MNVPVTSCDFQDLFVLLDLLGARGPTISNYITETNGEFRRLAEIEQRLRRDRLLNPGPRIFRYKSSWGLFGPPAISDDHLPFQRRGEERCASLPETHRYNVRKWFG